MNDTKAVKLEKFEKRVIEHERELSKLDLADVKSRDAFDFPHADSIVIPGSICHVAIVNRHDCLKEIDRLEKRVVHLCGICDETQAQLMDYALSEQGLLDQVVHAIRVWSILNVQKVMTSVRSKELIANIEKVFKQ